MRGNYGYNRSIPDADGSFRRMRVEERAAAPPITVAQPQEAASPPCPPPCENQQPACCEVGHPLRGLLPAGMDTGDLLILVILLLLLIDGDEDDTLSVLLTFAAFILM